MNRCSVTLFDGVDIGFSGSQDGMSFEQLHVVSSLVNELAQGGPFRVHLGDCVGADEEMRLIVRAAGGRTFGHPPDNPKKRAFGEFDEQADPFPYLMRNMHIVLAGEDGLVATPQNDPPPNIITANLRGQGTWTTIRYALSANRNVFVVLRDGSVWKP